VTTARIFVTWPMEAAARAILERVGSVETSPTEDELPADALVHAVERADALIPTGAHRVPKDAIAAAGLRVIAVAAVGYNLVDVAAAQIPTPRPSAPSTAPGPTSSGRRTSSS
jgi:phosphoglycerate dehydrogenase-like enzyme